MGKLSVLDCTLRDGGYCNNWEFGFDNIRKITSSLVETGIDIIECGFLSNKVEYEKDRTKFSSMDEISKIIPCNRSGKLFVCMVNFGELTPDELPVYDGKSVDGIRVAFHKKDMTKALELCKEVKAKGYKLFVQPMVSLNYSDDEFLNLIDEVNNIKPTAFYIVDSFGVMKRKDLTRLFYLVEHNLNKDISIGYHSHNNMQLAYSNAQSLVDIRTNRNIIIDSSVYGMGRGAGNLNTELFLEYLNDSIGSNYNLKPLLTIIDEILNGFYQQNYWGYSLPNYLSAKHNLHPNYAGYLDAKKTLTVENIDEIFSMMDAEKRATYDKKYIEELYLKYMNKGVAHENHKEELKKVIYGKKVLIIAPGKSSIEEKEKIRSVAGQNDIITISVNFDYSEIETDFIFVSNNRRFRELEKEKHDKCIITSNIPAIDVYIQTKYNEHINDEEAVKDNAGLLLIKFLITFGVNKIMIAGMDGYSVDPTQNFANQNMNFYTQKGIYEAMNQGIINVLSKFSKEVEIEMITTPKYIKFS